MVRIIATPVGKKEAASGASKGLYCSWVVVSLGEIKQRVKMPRSEKGSRVQKRTVRARARKRNGGWVVISKDI